MVKAFKINDRVEGKTSKVKGLTGIVVKIVRVEKKKDQYEVRWDNDTTSTVTSTALDLKRGREEYAEEKRDDGEEISPVPSISVPVSRPPSEILTGVDLEREESEER